MLPIPLSLFVDPLQPGRTWFLCTVAISVCFCLHDHVFLPLSYYFSYSQDELDRASYRFKHFFICSISRISWYLISLKISLGHSEIWKRYPFILENKIFPSNFTDRAETVLSGVLSPVLPERPSSTQNTHDHLLPSPSNRFSATVLSGCPSCFKNSSKKFHRFMFYSGISKWLPLS